MSMLERFLIQLLSLLSLLFLICALPANKNQQDDATSLPSPSGGGSTFPGVSRDLLPFCSARPSLPISLAMMVVHVKRDVSFNYKLYLLSDNYVFQTGQVIPRDDFKIHAFPAKVKRLSEFWPDYPRSFMQPITTTTESSLIENNKVAHNESIDLILDNSDRNSFENNKKSQILPVASFSSFDINTTYLVRKNFDQETPHILKLTIDANQFKVTNYVNISDHDQPSGVLVESDLLHWDDDDPLSGVPNTVNKRPHNHRVNHEDYDFLSHPILADKNTRITAITQIYEDWITRNYYTIVYVQRRMSTISNYISNTSSNTETDPQWDSTSEQQLATIYDRLIFRGASASLLAADQLDYPIAAAAFITEKNKLHYWLEFLSQGENRFQLRAIEWTTRPFKIKDANFATNSPNSPELLDNEELMLCPPSICYSYQPIDEIIDYGYIPLPPLQDVDIGLSVAASNRQQQRNLPSSSSIDLNNSNNNDLHAALDPEDAIARSSHHQSSTDGVTNGKENIPGIFERYRRFFSNHNATVATMGNNKGGQNSGSNSFDSNEYLRQLRLETKLHLRDWVWPLRSVNTPDKDQQLQQKFELRYDEGHRNPIKAKTDNYGYIITGHKVDASFRVFNEIYLISANSLITINYTQSDNSVVTKSSLNSEYPGLESTIDDPITAAYYDRYENQVYFIKGDRYSGYDFTNKSLLARFQTSQTAPVVELIGRQHRVDAIYHSMSSDLVYIFSGMRYYTYKANEFSNGYFNKSAVALTSEPKCINSNFMTGCQFDKAYKNPCQDRQEPEFHISSGNKLLMTLGGIKDQSTSDEFYLIRQQKIHNLTHLAGPDNKLIYNPSNSPTSDSNHGQFTLANQTIVRNQASLPEIVPLVDRKDGVKERHPACASQTIITYLTILSILLTSIVGVILAMIVSNWRRVKLLMGATNEPYLDREALSKVKNFHLDEPELSNSTL